MASSPTPAKRSVYLETSIVGHLTSRLSRDLVTAGHQELTQEWWETERRQFDLYISALVVDEAAGGQPDEAAKRLAALEGVRELDLNEECRRLARELLSRHAMPEEAATDALHVATAAVNGMNFLLTWNCAHMANAERRQAIEDTCRENGYEPPRICTPEELMGERPCQT